MRNIFTLFLFGCVFASCRNNSGDNQSNGTDIFHELIFTEITDTNATLCITKGAFHIYAEFPSSLSWDGSLTSGRYDHFFYLSKDDSIIAESVGDSLTVSEFMAAINGSNIICYDSLENFDFKYDSTSEAELVLARGEKIEHSSISKDLCVYTISNSGTLRTDMVLTSRGDTIRTWIGDHHEKVDFLLYDFVGDSIPEIFVVTHFRMPSSTMGDVPMIRLEIYRIQSK